MITAGRIAQLRTVVVVAALFYGFFAARNVTLHRPRTALLQASGALATAVVWWLARRATSERSLTLLGNASFTVIALILAGTSIYNGQLTSTTPAHLMLLTPAAAYILGIRAAFAWALISFSVAAGVAYVGAHGLVQPEFSQGPAEVVLGYLSLDVVLLALAVALRRATDAQLSVLRASESKVRDQSEELASARDAALEGTRAKSAFLATMSHELRTPLNAIIGMASVLDESTLTEDQRECVSTIRSSGDALLSLISEILDFSKLEAGKVELESAPFDLARCVEDAMDLLAPAAAEKGVELTFVSTGAVPAWVASDPTRVRQVLVNLLSNAVKFTPVGDVSVRLDARRLSNAELEIEAQVRDAGPGIAAEKMGRLFLPFSQLEASTTREYGGTGLGLAISRALVERLGGKIGVESEPGRGATFTFTFRAKPADAVIPEAERRAADLLQGKRVLVVGAQRSVREMLAQRATAFGAEVVSLATLDDEAGRAAMSGRWDAAVVNVRFANEPRSFAAARELRRRLPGVPLVLAVPLGRAAPEVSDFLQHEVAAVLRRPVKGGRLLLALARAVSREIASPRPGPSAEAEAPSKPSLPLRILIAEDNVVNQKVERQMIERLGHRAAVVGDGQEAIEAVRRHGYDVVLLDMLMPNLDGLETARRLCMEWPVGQRPRLIAVTANVSEEDRARCRAAGMDDFLAKPMRLSDLEAVLRGVRPSARRTDAGSSSEMLDRDVIASLRSFTTEKGTPLIPELVSIFLTDVRERVSRLADSLARGDARDAELQAHTIKGSASNLGVIRVGVLAATVEASARARNLEAAAASAERLRIEIERMEPVLRVLAKEESGGGE